ncbi:hypothetical protein C8Q74DRAFT_142137 [Fomes fomentarius]|nr:hypothetical protein C8Q74DRAFT_142137 [Fomes fomentarius]
MRFFLPYSSALLYLAIAHAEITGFSGDACNGDVGLNVPCDGSCHMFDNRHSFRVDAGVGSHCVTMFGELGCSGGSCTPSSTRAHSARTSTPGPVPGRSCVPPTTPAYSRRPPARVTQ